MLAPKLYEDINVTMNGTPVLFQAFSTVNPPGVGPFKIKYAYWDSEANGWSKDQDMGLTLSLEQWKHFQHDIGGNVPLHYVKRSTPMAELCELSAPVFAVVQGDATHLGRGNSWNGYRLGGLVVKLSSIVPYVWQNIHAYLSASESYAQAMREVKINQDLVSNPKLSSRIAEITKIETVGQKVAVTMPYLTPPGIAGYTELTQEHAEYLEETIHRMHRLGWAYLDQEIGFGFDYFGTPKIYDLSTVRHRSEMANPKAFRDWIEDDLLTISTMFKNAGLEPSASMTLRGKIRDKRHDAIMNRFKKQETA